MSEAERILWRRLSVFAGGFTLATAEVVCTDDLLPPEAVFDALTGLSEKSVVLTDRARAGRHRLVEPVRLYGRERLRAAGEECELLNRHRSWCSEVGAGLGQPWWTGHDQVPWLEQVRDEHANLRAALDFCLGDANEEVIQAGLQLVADLWVPWALDGSLLRAARATSRRCWRARRSRRPNAPGPCSPQARSRGSQGDLEAAGASSASCSDSRRRRGYQFESGLAALRPRAGGVGARRASTSARDQLEEAAARLRGRRRRAVYEALALFYLGETYAETDLERARALILAEPGRERARAARSASARSCTAGSASSSGCSETRRRRRSTIKAGLRLQREIGHRWGMAANLEALAWVDAAAGDGERAAEPARRRRQPLGGARDRRAAAARRPPPRLRAGRARPARRRALRGALRAGRRAASRRDARARARRGAHRACSADADGELSLLTRRELEVVHLVAAGATNREVAANLVISYQTVKTHLHHILAKLGFESRVELAAWYVRQQQPVG